MFKFFTKPPQSVIQHEPAVIEQPPKRKVILIHGANATPACFNYLISKLEWDDVVQLSYNTADGFYVNLELFIRQIEDSKAESPIIVSHSMGGLYALHLTKHFKFEKSISMSTPFAGATTADWARYMMPSYQLFRDVHTKALPIIQAKQIALEIPWTQIVTTTGTVPWMRTDNDGVVTIASQTQRRDVKYVYSKANHYEVLIDDKTISTLREEMQLTA